MAFLCTSKGGIKLGSEEMIPWATEQTPSDIRKESSNLDPFPKYRAWSARCGFVMR